MKISLLPFSFALCAALAWPTAPMWANDAYFAGNIGTPKLFTGENRRIRMESEKVVLTLKPDSRFETDARFVFVNDSAKKTTVRMGFPEVNSPNDYKNGQLKINQPFHQFATFVGGRKVEAWRTVISTPGKELDDVWWMKTVTFTPHERKNVRVVALSSDGTAVVIGSRHSLSYAFTGKNWKGLIARSDLEVRFPISGLWTVIAFAWNPGAKQPAYWKPLVEVKNGVGILRRTWRNWQAQSFVVFNASRVMPGWMEDKSEARAGSYDDSSELKNRVTFRVGRDTGVIGVLDNYAPKGFVREGVSFVEFTHFAGQAQGIDKKISVASSWEAKTRTATLQRGHVAVSFEPGSRVMTVRIGAAPAQTVTLRAAPLLIQTGDKRSLYVPLATLARALGLKVIVEPAKRIFSIEK